MKKILCFSIAIVLMSELALAQKQKQNTVFRPKPASLKTSSGAESQYKNQLAQALAMAKSGQYQQAANSLFSLSRRAELSAEKAQIKYILGLMLMEMKLYQVAAFQFVDVIRMNDAKYMKQAVEKLSVAADYLGDDTLLNYAVARVNVNDFQGTNKDMIAYRIGEVKQKSRDYVTAEQFFSKVQFGSSYYNQALFNKGLSQLEQNQTDSALASFQSLLSLREKAGVTDTNKVAAQLAIARVLYQKQNWDAAIEAYAKIPRDHFLWHDAIFEQSWAMLRAARFRSALSNFQTLHSTYYEDFYMPESLLLRAIVYLYICKYDEMEKVLTLYEKTYGPVRSRIGEFVKQNSESFAYFSEIDKANSVRTVADKSTSGLKLPYLVTRHILDEGDVRRGMAYLKKLSEEKAKIEANSGFRSSAMGQYGVKIILNRAKNTKLAIGDMVKAHLLNMRLELKDLYEQSGFIRYEMINGKKEVIKKKIAGRDLDENQIDQKIDREFYVQNGYEYYPFRGEYWLDEIGNYHYLGKQSCE